MAARAGKTLAPPLLPLPLRLPHPSRPHLKPRSPSLRARARGLAVARAASGGPPGPAEGDDKGKGKGNGRRGPALPALSEIRWRDLLLSPDPANAGAVVLTGALAWAGASLLLQLALVSASIVAAAVKYSFIAATLIFILIALL